MKGVRFLSFLVASIPRYNFIIEWIGSIGDVSVSAFGHKRTLANPSTAGVRVREAFQLLLGPAPYRPSLRRHRQIALDAHEIIYCISFFTAVVRLRAEADA